MSIKLNDHHFAVRGAPAPPVDPGLLRSYLIGSNGALARSARPGMEAGVPVSGHYMAGLEEVAPYVIWEFPRVPARFLDLMLAVSRQRCASGVVETLFYLSWSLIRPAAGDEQTRVLAHEDGWSLEFPLQKADDRSVEPLRTGAGSATERAVIEVHSHHRYPADFSADDDEDELDWFRVYAILGNIFDRPEVRARVAVFGAAWEFPASLFFELPRDLTDCSGANPAPETAGAEHGE